MRVDIAWAQLLGHQIVDGACGPVSSKIYHHRNVSLGAGDHCLLDGSPFRPFKVCGLDADYGLRIFEGHGGRGFSVHVGRVLLVLGPAHTSADDVELSKNARLGAVNDALLEVFEVAPTRAAGIDYSCHANAKSEAIGRHAVVTCIGA